MKEQICSKKEETSILRTLTSRSFQKNKNRNRAAILAVFLTTMMFTVLFTLTQSLTQNMNEIYLRQAGTMAHASTKQITDAQIEQIANHPNVISFGKSIVVGTAENPCLTGRQLEIRYANDSYAKNHFAYPTTGKMPENNNEIALDTLTIQQFGIPLKLGQTIQLEWRKDFNSPEMTYHSFTLCGWWEGNLSAYASMAWVSEDFALEACSNISIPTKESICGLRMMDITFSNSKNIENKIASILSDCGFPDIEFQPNITYTPEIQSSIFAENLPMYLGMVLVFLSGYFIIFNIFQISVASDILFYGKLKTLGMTKKQIQTLIYRQGNRISLIGIPAGLIIGFSLGNLLVPTLITATEKPTISVSPIIFIASSLFSYITVITSCMLPARLAGKVSPIEALRYTDADTQITKKRKKTKNTSLSQMAWANLWRNRKRTILVISSLTLGFVLMSFFYAKNASFDIEKYLMDLTVADYQIDDATNSSLDGYRPESQTIQPALLADIEALGTIEATGQLYSQQINLSLSEQTQNNLRTYYTDKRLEEFASYSPNFSIWKESFDLAVTGQENPYTIYGADGLILEAATNPNYILDGNFDAEKFATGDYILAIGPSIKPGNIIPTYSIGEKIQIADREFEVMAVLAPLRPMIDGLYPDFNLPLVLPADTFQEIWQECNLRKFYFNIADETIEDANSLLIHYRQTVSPGIKIVSRQSIIEQYQTETQSSAVIGYTISIVIALVGILNFANSMITAIASRQKEFAVIQSIGMTKRQLRSMLILEGLHYAGLSLAVSYLLSLPTVGFLVRAIVADGYSTFHFTLMPLVICTPTLIIFAILIPCLCFKNLEKQSLIERLRTTESS